MKQISNLLSINLHSAPFIHTEPHSSSRIGIC